jgi:hypothetical protein
MRSLVGAFHKLRTNVIIENRDQQVPLKARDAILNGRDLRGHVAGSGILKPETNYYNWYFLLLRQRTCLI